MWTLIDFMTYCFFYFLLLLIVVVGSGFTMYFFKEKRDMLGAGVIFFCTVSILVFVVNITF